MIQVLFITAHVLAVGVYSIGAYVLVRLAIEALNPDNQ